MISHARTATKFFTYGLLIGLLFAPRSGKETRSRILSWASENAKSFLGG
jgi:gas vesicle protein